MISLKITLIFQSSILILLTLLPHIKCDHKWYFESDLSEAESKTQTEIISPRIENTYDEINGTLLYASDLFDQLNDRNKSKDSISKGESSGRSAKTIDFEDLFSDKSERNSFQGDREPRIINDKDLSIKGFIPIVGFGNDKHDSEDKPKRSQESGDSQNYMNQQYSEGMNNGYSHSLNPQQHVSRPEDQRFIGAALQGLAASLSGQPIRKQGFGNEPNNLGSNDGCVCVPFYLCKNGYLSETAKSSVQKSPNIETAQSIINQFSIPMQNPRLQYQNQQKNTKF